MIHPAIEPLVLAARQRGGFDQSQSSVEERRRTYREELAAMQGELESMATVSDVFLPLDGRSLEARLYVPLGDESKALVVFFHGGGFVAGDLETHDALCRRLATDTGMRFLAIDYRLAPEHQFPAAIEDAVDSLRYVARHLGEFDEAAAKIIVMGESAGATLATVACMLTRDEELGVAGQVIIYPTLGPQMITDSAHSYGEGFMLDLVRLRRDYVDYLGEWTDHGDPRVSPLMSGGLS